MAKGGKREGAGRPKGSKADDARAAAIDVFFDLGGGPQMLEWAKDNLTDYYTKIFPKLLPKDVDVKASGDLTITIAR